MGGAVGSPTPSRIPAMDVMSTVFEKSCLFINGVGGCTTIVGAPSRGAHVNAPTVAPVSTSLPSASTPASSTSPPMPKSASPSPTLSLPSSTPPSTSLTAVGASNSPSTRSSPSLSNGPLSPPVTLSKGNTSTTSAITSLSDSTTVAPNASTSDTNTSVADTPSAAPSTVCSIPSTSPIPVLPSSSPSTSRLPAGAVAAIGISIAGIILVPAFGLIWYAARRRRRTPPIVVSSTSTGSNANASLSEATLAVTTRGRDALLPIEDESEKLEASSRISFTLSDGSGWC
ncbi:hypothetical protein V8D89_000399 [Ganoderma adspersum]